MLDDGFHSEFVEGAEFDGILEIPKIKKPDEIIIPTGITPFTKRHNSDCAQDFLGFYEYDQKFSDFLINPVDFLDDIKHFAGIVTPDCSLYRDLPFSTQIANTYISRAVGCFLQSCGCYVVPNIRWSDERSYTTEYLPEKLAFLGVEKESIVAVSAYGCIKSRENQYYFEAGLEAMLEELIPKLVLVYGAKPATIFDKYDSGTEFIQLPDWIKRKKGRV